MLDTNGSHPGTGSTNLNPFSGRRSLTRKERVLFRPCTILTQTVPALVTSAGVSIHASPAPSSV